MIRFRLREEKTKYNPGLDHQIKYRVRGPATSSEKAAFGLYKLSRALTRTTLHLTEARLITGFSRAFSKSASDNSSSWNAAMEKLSTRPLAAMVANITLAEELSISYGD